MHNIISIDKNSVTLSYRLQSSLIEVVFKRPVVLGNGLPAVNNVTGFIANVGEGREESLLPDGSLYGTRIINNWLFVEKRNRDNWVNSNHKEEKDKWVTQIKIDWIDYVKVIDQ